MAFLLDLKLILELAIGQLGASTPYSVWQIVYTKFMYGIKGIYFRVFSQKTSHTLRVWITAWSFAAHILRTNPK
jgi:hypothetical protein